MVRVRTNQRKRFVGKSESSIELLDVLLAPKYDSAVSPAREAHPVF